LFANPAATFTSAKEGSLIMIQSRLLKLFGFAGICGLLTLLLTWEQPGTLPQVRADGPPVKTTDTIDFNKQIRPILSDNCFACHGPDEKARKAKLRLDTKEGAFAALRSGGHALIPGKSGESELYKRLTTSEPTELMPPPKSTKKLNAEQIDLIKRWIDQGATWTEHWAYAAPKKAALPRVSDTSWIRNPIDQFIIARLEAEKLKPSGEADRVSLIRRVTLDLTGLPPTPDEVDAFVNDKSNDAYEKVIDRLMKSPRFGEHMARFWLDAARYGDTHGLHLDNYREMWGYRDWVVKAFNNNLPYNRFVIEQVAGDLLPGATLDQKIASGFNRCHVTTSEGGSIEEECYVRNVSDRVETFGTVMLGLTVGCARCHDHKYDPIKAKDYYQFFAFFNSLEGKGPFGNPLDGNAAKHEPTMRIPTPEQAVALEKLTKKIDEVRKQIADEVAKVNYDESKDPVEPEIAKREDLVWVEDALPAKAMTPTTGQVNIAWNFVGKPDHPVYSGEKSVLTKGKGLTQVVFEGAEKGLRVGADDVLFAYVYLDPKDPPKEIMLQWHIGQWQHRAYWGENLIAFGTDKTPQRKKIGPLPKTGAWVRLEVKIADVGVQPGTVIDGWAFTQFDGSVYWDKAGLTTKTPQKSGPAETLSAWLHLQQSLGGAGLPAELQAVLKLEATKRTPEQKKQLREHFIAYGWARTRPTFDPLIKEITKTQQEIDRINNTMPSTLVYKENKEPRKSFILKRGEYTQKGDEVFRATPSFLPPMTQDMPNDRLGLAQWLVTRDNPLTARVQVNRLWQQMFGTGLVKTAEDFGVQGEPPSHPELLDWLAVQFIDDGWDMRVTLKRMLTSAAYRQSAKVSKESLAKDPANRLLSRGPRHRLDAEMLRDQALYLGGVLVEKVGGPGVKPPQPSGLWEAVAYTGSNTAKFVADNGHEKVHRRSLYTFWKRTSPPPQMTTFDAPSRESCIIRRERTNTPLQALLLLNEPQYVESARGLAERGMREGGVKPEQRAAFMFRQATGRKPEDRELTLLVGGYQEQLELYKQDAEGAKKLINVGETKPDGALDPVQLAAWTMMANAILNLDEVLNK